MRRGLPTCTDGSRGRDDLALADIGTGTGAIALSVLHYTEGTRVDAVDISPAAAEVARENAERLGLAERIEVHVGDLTAPLAGHSYDVILSNPPYIPTADIATLMPEVRGYEPHLALDGGRDGLTIYRRLAADAPALLRDGGMIAVEVGIDEARDVAALMEAHSRIVRTEILKDLAGIERVVVGDTE